MDGEVLIVDEHTGRMLAGRRYNDGLHQAIEAKEGVTVREEYQTLATVTLQNYFRLYDKLSGMTGTAMTEASEFDKIYGLGVVPIPTNKPMAAHRPGRPRLPHRGGEVRRRRARTSPSATPRASRSWSAPSRSRSPSTSRPSCASTGIPHTVLNAKVHADEAKIVAMAGHKGAVTVATNMAGRGTDIMLGGSVDFLADAGAAPAGPRPGRDSRGVRGRVAAPRSSGSRARSPPSTTRSASSAASTSSAPSATSRAASTTSCAVVPAARATRASPGSTSRSRTS